MATYHEGMPTRALLPDEAEDMTVSELHVVVLNQLYNAIRVALGSTAVVLAEIFLRIGSDYADSGEQVSPDLLIVPGRRPGRRTVYRVPEEPVPSTTVEILSAANYSGEGRAQLEHKRDLLGRIGVPTHIEIDPERAYLTVWTNTGTHLQPAGAPSTSYHGDALGRVRLAFEDDRLRIWLPNGREYLDPVDETARLEEAVARLEDATAQAERLAELLHRHGIDPGAA